MYIMPVWEERKSSSKSAHRGDEASDDVLDGPQARIWPQAHNRLHSARGLLAWLFLAADDPGATAVVEEP